MKIYWSAFLSLMLLLVLAGCGAEQFGTTPQNTSSTIDPVSVHNQASCSQRTLIRPEIDFLFVVDNSTSNAYISSSIKSQIQGTINSISKQFDYRVIGTPLLETTNGNNDYQVLAESPASLPSFTLSKQITSSSQFTFFSNQVQGSLEPGLDRVRSFITAHQNDGLFRQNAYLFVVLVSNGYDTDIEQVVNVNGQTGYTSNGAAIYAQRKASLLQLKTYLNSQQFRLFSIVPHTQCQSGWRAATRSYKQMSQDLYQQHSPQLTDSGNNDSTDLCGSVSSVFAGINSSIQQITLPHKYKYWPITFSGGSTGLDPNSIKVYKSSPSAAPVLLPASAYSYIYNSSNSVYNTKVEPLPAGEPTSVTHLIEFTSGNEIVYPDCVQISSTTNTEYFKYVVIDKAPKLTNPVPVLKINGNEIPPSATNGWSYIGLQTNKNIKVNHNGYSDLPAMNRTGYFIQLNGSNNYYKSGDSVDFYYQPEGN